MGPYELTQVLELNERMRDNLNHREIRVREDEDEARRTLDQVLAQCAADHAAIAQERAVLAQAEQLYQRFLQRSTQESVAVDPQSPEWSQRLAMADAPHDQQTSAEQPSSLVDWAETASASGRNYASRVSDLRSAIRGQVSGDDATDQRSGRRAAPLRGALGSNA